VHQTGVLEFVEGALDPRVLCSTSDASHLTPGHRGVGPGKDAERVSLSRAHESGEGSSELHPVSEPRIGTRVHGSCTRAEGGAGQRHPVTTGSSDVIRADSGHDRGH
jgi:hypothetical protein